MATETAAETASTAIDILKVIWNSIDFPNSILMASMTMLVLVLASWHRDNSAFDFRQALVDPLTKEISFGRLGHFVALVVTTAVLLHQTAKAVVSEWMYLGYMATWAGTYVAAKTIDYKKTVASDRAAADAENTR